MNPNPRIPIVAALLSLFVPGLGQLYCGKVARALAFVCIGMLVLILMSILIRTGEVSLILVFETITGSLFSLVVTVDAWLLARKIPDDYVPDERNRLSGYLWFSGLVLLVTVLFSIVEARRILDISRTYRVAGASMNPTLVEGDFVFAKQEPFLESDPVSGELVVYQSPVNRKAPWLSRVIALPGQTVAIKNGKLLIDGEPHPSEESGETVVESFGDYRYEVMGMDRVVDFGPVRVPEYHVFLLCDHRNKSQDSRHFGPVAITSIHGSLQAIYFPRTRSGEISQPKSSP